MGQVTVDLRTTQDGSASSRALKARGREGASEGKAFPLQDPLHVVAHPVLDTNEKRALLASWASDACAVESLPDWLDLHEGRRSPGEINREVLERSCMAVAFCLCFAALAPPDLMPFAED